jgi:hypothetical protein
VVEGGMMALEDGTPADDAVPADEAEDMDPGLSLRLIFCGTGVSPK